VSPVDFDDDSCEGCSLAPRRTFLLGMSSAVLTAMVGSGWDAGASELPVSLASGMQGAGNSRTYAVPAEDGATIDRDAQVILVRLHGRAYAFTSRARTKTPSCGGALKTRVSSARGTDRVISPMAPSSPAARRATWIASPSGAPRKGSSWTSIICTDRTGTRPSGPARLSRSDVD